MSLQLRKKSILQKTFQFGALTFLSRILGIIRERLQVQLLGISALSDAFIIAFRIPNSLRKVFAEGALSAAFVPVFIKTSKDTGAASRLMSASFLFFEGTVFFLTIFVWFFPAYVVKLIASGFADAQLAYATEYLRVLFPFIFFISSSALLAGALQSVNHFFMTAFAPVMLNLFFIGSLFLCLTYGYSITFLCYGILAGGCAQFLLYLIMYFYKKFSFKCPDGATMVTFRRVLSKFINCLFGVSVMELNFLIDGNIASHLDKGSVSLLYYGTRFMQIPLGIFAVGFSTVLLSHLSRVTMYAPRRLKVYLFESAKFIFWIILPATLFLIFTSDQLFSTLIMTKNVSPENIYKAGVILAIMASGLVFFSLNKVITSVFYSLGDTWSPTFAGALSTVINLCANVVSLMLLADHAIFGIAAATVLSGASLTAIALWRMKKRHGVTFYFAPFCMFLARYVVQLACACVLFYGGYHVIMHFIAQTSMASFFMYQWGYFLVVLPLAFCVFGALYVTRRLFKIKLYFLER